MLKDLDSLDGHGGDWYAPDMVAGYMPQGARGHCLKPRYDFVREDYLGEYGTKRSTFLLDFRFAVRNYLQRRGIEGIDDQEVVRSLQDEEKIHAELRELGRKANLVLRDEHARDSSLDPLLPDLKIAFARLNANDLFLYSSGLNNGATLPPRGFLWDVDPTTGVHHQLALGLLHAQTEKEYNDSLVSALAKLSFGI